VRELLALLLLACGCIVEVPEPSERGEGGSAGSDAGLGAPELMCDQQQGVNDMLLADSFLYFGSATGLQRIPVDQVFPPSGCMPETVSISNSVPGWGLANAEKRIFVSSVGGGIHCIDTDAFAGSTSEVVPASPNAEQPRGLLVDSDRLYWTNYDALYQPGLYSVSLGGASSCPQAPLTDIHEHILFPTSEWKLLRMHKHSDGFLYVALGFGTVDEPPPASVLRIDPAPALTCDCTVMPCECAEFLLLDEGGALNLLPRPDGALLVATQQEPQQDVVLRVFDLADASAPHLVSDQTTAELRHSAVDERGLFIAAAPYMLAEPQYGSLYFYPDPAASNALLRELPLFEFTSTPYDIALTPEFVYLSMASADNGGGILRIPRL